MRLDIRWIALAVMLPVAAARADTNSDYAYAFALDGKASGEAYRLALTPEVYASVNPAADLRDLIVVNALGRPVPFAPMPPSLPARHHYETAARLLPLPVPAAAADSVKVERNTAGGIVISQGDRAAVQRPDAWLLDAGRAMNLDALALDPASLKQDFQLRLAVEGSDDLRQWNLLASDLSLTRVHGEQDQVEQLNAEVSSSDAYRYYRMRLTDGEVDWSGGHAPSATLFGSYTDAAAEHASQLQWLTATASGQAGADYAYELPAALPVESVSVALPAANNAARVHVLVQDSAAAPWSEVTALDLVRTGKNAEATASIDTRHVKHLRLHSDTPLAGAPALRVGWLPAQFVFMPEGSAPYRLLAGSYAARRGDYPVDEALSRLRVQHGDGWQPVAAMLGPRVDEAGPSALAAPKVPYDWTRPLLWAVLALGALVVGWMAFSLLRQSGAGRDSS